MSPELGAQLAYTGFELGKGLGDMFADKVNRKKKIEDIREINALRESYAERINGPGSGGGTEMGHLGDINYVDYFMPAIQSLAATGYYQAANYAGNKAYEAYLKNKKAAGEADLIKRPVPSGDSEAEDLEQTISKTPKVDSDVIASNDHQGWFQALGMYPTTSPVGKTSQTLYIAGMDPEVLKLFGKVALTMGTDVPWAKKGTKLIPRQK